MKIAALTRVAGLLENPRRTRLAMNPARDPTLLYTLSSYVLTFIRYLDKENSTGVHQVSASQRAKKIPH
jgi:hypothetical protein